MKITLPKIICQICNKEVDNIECHQNTRRNSLVFKVRCHGEVDTAELTHHDLASEVNIVEAKAFAQKLIPEGEDGGSTKTTQPPDE